MNNLSDVQREDLAADAQGTLLSEAQLLERSGLGDDVGEDEVIEILLDEGVERCPECGWWVHSWELVDEDGNETVCENCRMGREDERGNDET